MTLRPIDQLVAVEHQGEYREDLASITGTRSDLEIAEWVAALVTRQLGSNVRGGLFATKSVGAVFGLELESGERVVLKIFHPRLGLAELAPAQRCLELAISRGFPAPRPVTPLFPADDSVVGGFYSFVDGDIRDGHDPSVRRELAHTLAELATVLGDVDPDGLPLAPSRTKRLWPPPHRTFTKLCDDSSAHWIDEIGRRAQSIIRAAPVRLFPVHLDWGVKNVRFRDSQISAVFDWDSLHTGSECEMVGWASVQFTAQWSFQARLTPTAEETALFINEYEAARGRAFSSDERRVIAASADYMVALDARFEHAAGGSSRPDSFLALLRARGS